MTHVPQGTKIQTLRSRNLRSSIMRLPVVLTKYMGKLNEQLTKSRREKVMNNDSNTEDVNE